MAAAEDFAGILVAARERARLTQAEAAQAAGLTPSYLCFLERRRKPPPSDEVCRRLAEVLGIPPTRLLEVAHMERAPETVQRRVKSLRHNLRRERRSRLRVLASLLSPFLLAGPAGHLEGAVDALGMSPTRRRRLREVLGAVGRRHHDRANQVAHIIDELPERDRKLLLEALPRLLGRDIAKSPPDRAGPPPARAARPPQAPGSAPELRYAPPAPEALAPYLLAVEDDTGGAGLLDLRAGDRLLVEPGTRPVTGDVLVLRTESGGVRLRRLERAGPDWFLHGGGPEDNLGPLTTAALARLLAEVGAGVVREVRRPLRPGGSA